MKKRHTTFARGLWFGVVVLTMLTAACRPTESPDFRGSQLSFEGQNIDSRAEHKEAVDALLEGIRVLPGVEKATAIFIESVGFIGIQGKADPEFLRVRSLRKEVAMRSVEISDYIVQAYVTDDPVLFERIEKLRDRIDRREDSQELRDAVAALQVEMQRTGTSSDLEDGPNAGKTENHPPIAGEPAGPEDKIQYGQPPWPR